MYNVENNFVYNLGICDIGNDGRGLVFFLIEIKYFFIWLKVNSCYKI